MPEITSGISNAFEIMIRGDSQLFEIIALSLQVTLIATILSAIIALPLGTLIAVSKISGKGLILLLLNTLMSLPPVLVGLVVYLLLSRSGPFGVLDLLFTPSAMIIAQTIIITPIITGITHRIVADKWLEISELFFSLAAVKRQIIATLLWDNRKSLVTAVITGFGRAIGEVGAIMIVGGNIEHITRVMTTAITLEARRGNLGMAIGLGIILMLLSLAINAALYLLGEARKPV